MARKLTGSVRMVSERPWVRAPVEPQFFTCYTCFFKIEILYFYYNFRILIKLNYLKSRVLERYNEYLLLSINNICIGNINKMCSSVRHCQIQKLLIYMKSIGSVYGFASNALIKCSMLIGIPVNWYVLNENKK